jgi:hypothetical protein
MFFHNAEVPVMTLKFAAILFGCTLVGAAGAAYHRVTTSDAAASPAALPQPLFLQAAMETPPAAPWPPSGSVAFYSDMVALQTATATTTPRVIARAPTPDTPAVRDPRRTDANEPVPQRAGVTPPRGSNADTVVIRDRFGRPVRVERVDRRRFAGPRGYPPPYRLYGPYGPYGPPPYGPYMR